MSTKYVTLKIPFSVALALLKQDFCIYRESWCDRKAVENATLTHDIRYLFYLNGCNAKASSYQCCYGEYEGEPVFTDTVCIIVNGRITPYTWVTEDLYATDYFIRYNDSKHKEIMQLITPLMPYGCISGEVHHGL